MKPFYNKIVKKDKVKFKTPSSTSDEEYNSFLGKSNWNGAVKYSLYSINLHCPDKPIRLCHLLMHIASKLKIFGYDAFGKVTQ